MLAPIFYIYRHIRRDKDEVFYIGKGTFTKRHKYDRAHAEKKNPLWRSVVAKCGGYDVEMMMEFDTEAECFAKEREFIALYGRRDTGKGTLCNLTDGGEGHLGIVISDERRRKMSDLVSGERHPNFGKMLSPETCRKKSEAIKGEKHHLYGKRLSEEWKDHIRQSKFGADNPMYGKTGFASAVSKAVRNTETGAIYGSVQEAAKAEGLTASALYQYLDGTRKNKTPLVRA